ncbi:MAG: UxaA family hydrolase [Anaerolineae bacterium]
MPKTVHFQKVARIPLPGDNVAIATRRLEAGTTVVTEEGQFTLDCTVMEGHRFAIQPIAPGETLLSWGLPFGLALRPIEPGAYVCNAGMLAALRGRPLDFELPAEPNFEDHIAPYVLDEATFQPAEQLPLYQQPRTFMGYRREGQRGVGTRNYIVLLGTSSRTAGYVRQLENYLQGVASSYRHLDGIVAAAHTEGGYESPNNLELVLRTLAGFMVHPNVGAVLAVDYGLEVVTNERLRAYMLAHGYPLEHVPHQFISLTGSFQDNLERGAAIVRAWLEPVNAAVRSEVSLAELKVGLQCGGSDAFSGISANPLAGWVAKEIIRYGGSANLAETDELIGAEAYALQKIKDVEAARRFLNLVERFKERAAWHGATAEGNPTGGNKFRGLYNIVLKSIGAARKRDPDVRLDYVIEYAQRMQLPGFYFMDSPGNDLESVAGQVAAGCSMIFFTTGNGSITNFPFVPTLKVVTTTQRYQLLAQEMDVNAGAYLDGAPLTEVGQHMLDLTVQVASGQRAVGEKAGHAQVQIWRNWRQKDAGQLNYLLQRPQPDGASLPIKAAASIPTIQFPAVRGEQGYATAQVGLILPTSLCAGQIARLAAERLNRQGWGLSRFVALSHTEGCGVSSGPSEELYVRTLLGYLTHPMVKHAVLLEHGCEKTHNDYMRHRIEDLGLDPAQFGWASIQMDGGIEKVMGKIESWFAQTLAAAVRPVSEMVGLESLRWGLIAAGPVTSTAAASLAEVTRAIVSAGGTVVTPGESPLLAEESPYRAETLGDHPSRPSLAYGQPFTQPGFHIMETQSGHWVEMLTGLAASGVELILAYAGEHPLPSHPLVPVIQLTAAETVQQRYGQDLDLNLAGASGAWAEQIMQLLAQVLSGQYSPKLHRQGNIDFQITRGLLGISL